MAKPACNTTVLGATTRSLGRAVAVSGIALLVSGSVAVAQTRLAIRPTPKPGQEIRVTTQQEVTLRIGEKPEEPGPSTLSNKNLLAYKQTNGNFDAQGRLLAQVTIERLELNEATGNRQRQAPDTASLVGRTVVVAMDRTGKLLAINVPPDINNALSLRITQLLAGSYGMLNFVPEVELAVGQEAKNTTELPIRLPGNVSQGPMGARTTVTLRAVDKKGPDRIAHLREDIEVDTATTQLKVTGGGTIDVNLDKGFVSATDIQWTMSGTIPTSNPGQQSPPFYGTVKITVSAN